MKTSAVLVALIATTGCGGTISAMADLARASSGISWPGAFVCVGVIASLCYAVGQVFGGK